jgi:hypothetical protein
MREFLATKQITILEHPSYSLDLVPNNFFLFLRINEILKGKYFDAIRSNTLASVHSFPRGVP